MTQLEYIDQLLSQVAVTKVKKDKLGILSAAKIPHAIWPDSFGGKFEEIFTKLFYLYYDPYTHFGISNAGEREINLSEASTEYELKMWYGESHEDASNLIILLTELADKTYSARELKIRIGSWMQVYNTPVAHKMLNAWLGRSFRLGLSYDTMRKVFTDLTIRGFGVKLCEPYSVLDGEYFVQDKIDGYRGILIPEDGELVSYSRNGNLLYNTHLIKAELSKFPGWEDWVYDGELFCSDWSSSSSLCKTEYVREDAHKLHLRLFTMIPKSEWKSGQFQMTERQRAGVCTKLSETYWSHSDSKVNLLPYTNTIVFNKDDEGQFQVVSDLTDEAISRKHEGIILKRTECAYSFERDLDWVKSKQWFTEEFKLVGVESGNGRLSETTGKIILENEGVEFRCGTGLSDRMRKYIWDFQAQLIDTYVEVKFQEKTKDKSVRFPVFQRLRDDK